MTLTRKAILLATAALCATSPALADDDVIELDPIRIESEEAQAALGNTQITSEEIQQRNAETMADVFTGKSEIISSGGAGIAQKVIVHGIEESMMAVTIDGARQNKSAFHHTGNVLIDPFLLKRVEISAGLAPADAGPGALAGVIAYETKDARDFLEAGDNFGGYATLSYGDNGNNFRRGLTLAGRSEGFEFLLSGVQTTGDDYKDGSGNVVSGTEPDMTSYSAKASYTTETGKRFEVSASQTEDTGTRAMQAGPGGLYFARPDFAGVVGRPSVYLPALSRRRSYVFSYFDEAPSGIWAPEVLLTYNEQYIEAGGAVGKNSSYSGKVENDFFVGNGVLTAGVDFFDDAAEGLGTLNSAPAKETLQNIGLYAQMRQDVSSTVSLSYGARVDTQQFTLADGQKLNDTGISVNGQADVILSDNFTLNVGLASSWGGYELSEASLINFFGPWAYGTPKASRANNARVGLRYDSGPWQVSGALFYTEIKDANDVLSASRTLSDITSQGVDASVAYVGGSGFIRLNYTYADVKQDGSTIPSTAYYYGRPVGHMFGLEGVYEVSPNWQLGGTAEIALKNDDTAVPLDAYQVFNVFAAYTPTKYDNLVIRLDVRNLLDQTYSSRASDGIDLPSRIVPLNEPGRTISLSASLKF
jgi:hemoglobin/transferrin/lactoferrin receptor protein